MKKGITLLEIIVTILIVALIISAITSLYVVHQKVQPKAKSFSDIIEIEKVGMAQLEWIFSRWGTGTPCNDPIGGNRCTRIRPCDINNEFVYPPPSTLCVSVREGDPCGEIWFYANTKGLAFVNNIFRNRAKLISCRLETENDGNIYCFHIMRNGRFFRDANHNDIVLMFSLLNLDNQNAECLDDDYYENPALFNAQCDRNATIHNGNIQNQYGRLQNWVLLEGGDIIIHLPKLIHLHCSVPDRNGIRWLVMTKEFPNEIIPDVCSGDRNIIGETIKIAPVVSFQPSIITPDQIINDTFNRNDPENRERYLNSSQGAIRIRVTFRNLEPQDSPYYKTITVERIFGRL